jgi:hypothetical protein
LDVSLTYREPPYDDASCVTCHTLLPLEPAPQSWEDHGFCNIGCALRCPAGIHIFGPHAEELAEYAGGRGGPGFERDIVRDWLKAARPEAPLAIARLDGAADLGAAYATSWVWRLWSGGICHTMRLTRKVP